jgi:hypothetical protein
LLIEFCECALREFVATELGKELLLSRQIEILVGLNLFLNEVFAGANISMDRIAYPNALHVVRNTICGNALVVRGFEDVVVRAFLGEAPAQVNDFRLKLVRNKDLMREPGERKVEIIFELAVLELFRLGEALPNLMYILGKCRLEVVKRSRADVVADNEEQKCPLAVAGH